MGQGLEREILTECVTVRSQPEIEIGDLYEQR